MAQAAMAAPTIPVADPMVKPARRPNRFMMKADGRVDSILFNGANSRVLVRDRAGELIEADVVLTGGPQDLKPKDDVTLSWSPEQTMSFKA